MAQIRTTKQQLAIQAGLAQQHDFVSTQQLHQYLTDTGSKISLATTYRILQGLAENQQVDVVLEPNGQALYRQCGQSGHHHHVRCRMCSTTVEVASDELERLAAALGKEHGFGDLEHTVEITGVCQGCQASGSAPAK